MQSMTSFPQEPLTPPAWIKRSVLEELGATTLVFHGSLLFSSTVASGSGGPAALQCLAMFSPKAEVRGQRVPPTSGLVFSPELQIGVLAYCTTIFCCNCWKEKTLAPR